MLPPWVLKLSWQTTPATNEFHQHAPAELIDILRSSDGTSTIQIMRYLSSSSSELYRTKNHCHVTETATFCSMYDNGFAVSTATLEHRLTAYVNELDDQARGLLPHAKDISRSLMNDSSKSRIVFNDRCRHSPFVEERDDMPGNVEDYENPWFLFVQSPYQNADTGEGGMRLIRIRACTPIRACCRICRVRNDLESAKRFQPKRTPRIALLDGNAETEKAHPRRILEMQHEADAEGLPFDNWPQKKTVHNDARNSDQRPAPAYSRDFYGRHRRMRGARSRTAPNACESCKITLHECDRRKPICTHCLRYGDHCTYRSNSGQAILPKAGNFNKVRSDLNKMETANIIETQYALGKENAKHLPQWNKKAWCAPTYFVRTNSRIEVFSPGLSRRFVKLRQHHFTKPKKALWLWGTSCVCEKCLANRWYSVRLDAEAQPKKSVLTPFLNKEQAGYQRWDKSRLSRLQARQASGFAKHIIEPSKLREIS
jgi:hypothetical protein